MRYTNTMILFVPLWPRLSGLFVQSRRRWKPGEYRLWCDLNSLPPLIGSYQSGDYGKHPRASTHRTEENIAS